MSASARGRVGTLRAVGAAVLALFAGGAGMPLAPAVAGTLTAADPSSLAYVRAHTRAHTQAYAHAPAPAYARAQPVPHPVAHPAAHLAARGTADTPQPPGPLTLTAITPSVATPGIPVTVTGTVRAAPGQSLTDPVVRVTRSSRAMTARSDVTTWAQAPASTPSGVEVGRVALTGTLRGDQELPFRIELPATALVQTRSVGTIPITVELIAGASTQARLRTFIGWHRLRDYEPLGVAIVLPLTLSPDPTLTSDDPAVRAAAWSGALGTGGRLSRLLSAGEGTTISYAVDPAILGPPGGAGGPAVGSEAERLAFIARLRAAGTTDELLALPYGDPDLAVLIDLPNGSALLRDLHSATPSLSQQLGPGVSVGAQLSWPADGALPAGREAALRAAYGEPGLLLNASAVGEATDPTPNAAATTALGSPAVRFDPQLSALLDQASRPDAAIMAAQEFLALSAAVLAERPSVARTIVAVAPRGLDPVGSGLSALLQTVGSGPWLRPTGLGPLLTATDLTARPIEPAPAPDTASASPITADAVRTLARVEDTLAGWTTALPARSSTVGQLREVGMSLISTRWRAHPEPYAVVAGQLDQVTERLNSAVSVSPQTTNFLADEGLLQVTVVNDLDEPVTGLQLLLTPGNARMHVVEPPEPVSIGPRSRATVRVRMAAVTQGVVPITARLQAGDGTRLGRATTLQVRAAPPGAWLYVIGGAGLGLILLVGTIRSLRKPAVGADLGFELDPIYPIPEPPPSAEDQSRR